MMSVRRGCVVIGLLALVCTRYDVGGGGGAAFGPGLYTL